MCGKASKQNCNMVWSHIANVSKFDHDYCSKTEIQTALNPPTNDYFHYKKTMVTLQKTNLTSMSESV